MRLGGIPNQGRQMVPDESPAAAQNIFQNIPAALPEELVDVLQAGRGVRIERIVSRGHRSPAGFWYDQPQDEWVLLVRGAARLSIEGQDQPVELKPGDFLKISAHQRHRVEWTDPGQPTIWLAVHYYQVSDGQATKPSP